LRNYFDLAANAGFPAVDVVFPAGGFFRSGELGVVGTNDVFIQAVPSSGGYGYLETCGGVGLRVGTGGASTPIIFTPNRTEAMRITGTGNLGIGTDSPSTKLHVVGDVTVSGNIAAKYQDVAEWVPARAELAPGTVVSVDHAALNGVLASTQAYDTAVAGVISAQPGIVLGEAGPGKVLAAQSGRVRVRANTSNGPIRAGDLLVTSAIAGQAMRSTAIDIGGTTFHRPGTILGKALEPLGDGTGEILVLLTLQ
jgi:hypothetical protein